MIIIIGIAWITLNAIFLIKIYFSYKQDISLLSELILSLKISTPITESDVKIKLPGYIEYIIWCRNKGFHEMTCKRIYDKWIYLEKLKLKK